MLSKVNQQRINHPHWLCEQHVYFGKTVTTS